MNIRHIIEAIESYAPRSFQEKWDNSGLQIALPEGDSECSGVLVCLDVNEDIIAEAVSRGCNLVVSHHPLIFKGFKSLTGSTVQERAAMAAIRAGVAVYSAHTSLDSTRGGVSYAMATLLGAEVTGVLQPSEGIEKMLTVTCPRKDYDDVRLLMLDNDSDAPLCASNTDAADIASCVSFDCRKDSADAPENEPVPTISFTHTPLCRVEGRLAAGRVAAATAAIQRISPTATFTVSDAPADNGIGLGVFATLPGTGISGEEFAARIKKKFGCRAIRVSAGFDPSKKIRRIALCGGAGGEFIAKAIGAGVDAYVTADIRYHDFADIARTSCAVFDIGHFESETCAKFILHHAITKKIPNFAVYYSEIETNPIKYL